MRAILLDIEGTTTPIEFVHKTLFPFARSRMHEFVRENFDSLGTAIDQLVIEHEGDPEYDEPLDSRSVNSVSNYLLFLIDRDRKSTPLKMLQGKIWETGYRNQELFSEMYDDVPRALKRWTDAGVTIHIFSSGSVLAQKLIFGYSNHGDLTQFISSYFDTTNGPKRDAASYIGIARTIRVDVDLIIFVSDVVAELDAAHSAGLATCLSMRPGNAVVDLNLRHRSVENFDELI